MEKFGKWIKAIFTTCTYAARTAYQDRLENHEANQDAREHAGLPPLSLVQSPSRFDDLPSLSKTDLEDKEEEEQEQPELDPHTRLSSTLQSMRRSTKPERHTSTTHRQGRAVVSSSSSSDDDGNGGEEDVVGASGAASGDDVDWDTIQEDDECVLVFLFSSLFGALCQRGRKLEGSTTFLTPWRGGCCS